METPRSTRGLRHLTTLVKQLVCKYQPTSFKNVAVKLIDELVVTDGPERLKEEKNVRRRVYDAGLYPGKNVVTLLKPVKKRQKLKNCTKKFRKKAKF